MKIAMMTNNYKPVMGGVPISIERLKISLEKIGHEVTVFAPSYENQEEEEGVIRYQSLLKRFVSGIVLPNPFDPEIEKQFCEKQFDIIHVHHPFLIGNTALYLSRKYKVPLVFTYHTQYEAYVYSYAKWAAPVGKLLPMYLHGFLKKCDAVFVPTKSMQEYLHTQWGVSYKKMDILPTGLPEEHFYVTDIETAAVRRKYHAEGMPMLISVSRMAKEKNVDFLLETIAVLKEKYHHPFKVLFVGDGPDRKAYEKLCQEKELTDVICFTGKIENKEVASYLTAADAFVFASKTETQGIVILEAFAGKTPVYALDAYGVRDMVREEVNGKLLPEDKEIFAEELLALLDGKKNVEVMAENAYNTALQFREEVVAAKAIELYNRTIADRSEPAKYITGREIYG